MNNNLFTIDDSERQRILEMHQSATKKQYLGEDVTTTQTTTFDEKNLVDFSNDPDFINLRNTIAEINKITLGWPAPSKGFSDVSNLKKQLNIYAKPKTRALSLFSQKVDKINSVDVNRRRIIDMNLGVPANITTFNPGTEFVAAKKEKNEPQAETLLKTAVEHMVKFVGKFSKDAYFYNFAANDYKIYEPNKSL